MNYELKNDGFSLTEVLMAVGTLAIGMLFIAGVFPVAIRFTTIATERTIAAVVADEAFAKIRIYDVNLDNPNPLPLTGCHDFNGFSGIWPALINPAEFAYPSTRTELTKKQYYWSALCRRVAPDPNNRLVQVTVFISRRIRHGTLYRDRYPDGTLNPAGSLYPIPIYVNVLQPVGLNADELLINDLDPDDTVDERTFINDGYTIVDNQTGQIYRVLERDADQPDRIILDRPWQGSVVAPPTGGFVWVVPPPAGSSRYPCIAVYQKVIRF